MSVFDIFNQNAFSVMEMSEGLREIKHVPGYIGRRGLFSSSSISTLAVAIEKDKNQNLMLVPASPRGGVGATFEKKKRSMRYLEVPHFEVNDAIYADEVQSARQFGTENAVETLQSRIADRAGEATTFFDLTEEYHRLKVITTGKLYDSDGVTEIYDYASEFGEVLPAEIDFSFDTNTGGLLRKFCMNVHRTMAASLDGLPFMGVEFLCGDAFFDDLVGSDEVRETYLGTEQAKALRTAYVSGSGQNDMFGEVEFGGIRFINYRGNFLGAAAVDTDKAFGYPVGVPGLFRTIYAPADYIETVNRPGLRLYAKQYDMANGKGVHLDFQSNALHYITRPRTIIRAKRT